MQLEDRVFFARSVGYFDNVDVRMWAKAFKKYAGDVEFTIIGVIDLREVDRLCATISKFLPELLQANGVAGLVVIVGDVMASRNARVLDKLNQLERVTFVQSQDEALSVSSRLLNPTFGGWSAESAYCSVAVAAI